MERITNLNDKTSFNLSLDLLVSNTRTVIYVYGGSDGGAASSVSTTSITTSQEMTRINIPFSVEMTYDYLQLTIMVVDQGTTYVDNIYLTSS